MGILSSLNISKRLYLLCILVTLALAGLVSTVYSDLAQVSDRTNRTGSARVPQLQRAALMELSVTRVSLQLRHAILARTPEEMNASLADVSAKRQIIDKANTDYGVALFTPQGRVLWEKLQPLVKEFWIHGEANIKLIQEGKKVDAFAFLVDKTIPARNQVLAVLDELVHVQENGLKEDISDIDSRIHKTTTILIVVSMIIVIGLFAFAVYLAATLRKRAALAEDVANRVRDGDLSTNLRDDANDEFSPILSGLSEMQTALSRVVSSVRINADSVATASAEISQGNNDLSGRTEQQASALEETAASMEELGSTVRHNADNAKQASQLAQQASSVALAGGEVVSEVVTAIRRVTDIVGEISSASQEQSQGVAQVGEAVTQMDQTTQQNAALVEQSAAAADSLKTQALALVEAVAVFKLGAEGVRSTAVTPARTRKAVN